MADNPEIALRPAEPALRSAEIIPFPTSPAEPSARPSKPVDIVAFNKKELMLLLSVYGRKVSAGEWRDYALDMLKDSAFFSIFRRTSERPQYVVEKNPKLRNRQGQFTVTNAEGRVLRRGHDLEKVLRVFDQSMSVVK